MAGLLFLAAACNNDHIFKKEIELPDGGWYYNRPVVFEFDINDVEKKYDLLLGIEHAGDFGFQNLYVQFHTVHPSGEKRSQVVSLELANKTGIWNGKCRGNACNVEIPLQINATFKETGRHSITVEQYMRRDPVVGVQGLTLKISQK